MSPGEIWRSVEGYSGIYEVSDRGRVRSLDRTGADGRFYRGIILTQMTPGIYRQVNLHNSGQRTHHVHRLVATAFLGSGPAGHEIRHLNGNPLDNSVENLAWGTHVENMADRKLHGTHRNSVKTHCPAGHSYSGENLRIDKHGQRRCVICRRESFRRATAKRNSTINKAA